MTDKAQYLPEFPIDRIDPGLNVRLDETALEGLASSIRELGVLQPITIIPADDDNGRAECLFGHRRLAAATLAGLATIPVLARPRGSGEVRVLMQFAENHRRKDMTVLEEALTFAELRKLGMTQTAIADAVGMAQADVSRRLQLLRYPEVVRLAVHRRNIYINDALSIPLDLAKRTDGRTLAAILRRGAAFMRLWIRQELSLDPQGGRPQGRKTHGTVAVEVHLLDEVKAAARRSRQSIGEWTEDALRSKLGRRS